MMNFSRGAIGPPMRRMPESPAPTRPAAHRHLRAAGIAGHGLLHAPVAGAAARSRSATRPPCHIGQRRPRRPRSLRRRAGNERRDRIVAGEAPGSKLFVGVNIKFKGVEISDCDLLVIEGHVEATVHSKEMQIAQARNAATERRTSTSRKSTASSPASSLRGRGWSCTAPAACRGRSAMAS